MDAPLPDRHRPVHPPPLSRHNEPTIVFVTVCTKDRQAKLANDRVHASLRNAWAAAKNWRVGHYTMMPDHVHMFCSPATIGAEPVSKWAAYWKSLASRALPDLQPLWQRDCWDTQLRRIEHYDDKWEYVRQNPVRKQLVPRPEDWPFQGEMNVLFW